MKAIAQARANSVTSASSVLARPRDRSPPLTLCYLPTSWTL